MANAGNCYSETLILFSKFSWVSAFEIVTKGPPSAVRYAPGFSIVLSFLEISMRDVRMCRTHESKGAKCQRLSPVPMIISSHSFPDPFRAASFK